MFELYSVKAGQPTTGSRVGRSVRWLFVWTGAARVNDPSQSEGAATCVETDACTTSRTGNGDEWSSCLCAHPLELEVRLHRRFSALCRVGWGKKLGCNRGTLAVATVRVRCCCLVRRRHFAGAASCATKHTRTLACLSVWSCLKSSHCSFCHSRPTIRPWPSGQLDSQLGGGMRASLSTLWVTQPQQRDPGF